MDKESIFQENDLSQNSKIFAKNNNVNCQSKTRSSKEKIPKLPDCVKDYLDKFENVYNEQFNWWGDKHIDWAATLERAWRSRFPDGKMHPHQYRVSPRLEAGLKIARSDCRKPEDFKTFEELHDWINSITHRVKGLGSMTAYDVTQRLGMWLNLEPDVVYLHAGAAEGAAKLQIYGDVAPLSAFPPKIQKLGASHAENFLCIYKDCLG